MTAIMAIARQLLGFAASRGLFGYTQPASRPPMTEAYRLIIPPEFRLPIAGSSSRHLPASSVQTAPDPTVQDNRHYL